MLTAAQITAAAHRLDAAEKSRSQIGLLSLEHPHMDMADAYAIQAAWVAMRCAAGRSIKGHKIGLTSRAMQQALNIDIPDSGVLLDDMFFDDQGDIPTARFIATRIEAELAFTLKSPLSGPDLTIDAVLDATDFILPAFEILDTRILRADPATGKARTICDTIADNAANAGIVMGGQDRRHRVTQRRG
jgi:2-oxo-hept-3-ene-1,7-dioate hydratase